MIPGSVEALFDAFTGSSAPMISSLIPQQAHPDQLMECGAIKFGISCGIAANPPDSYFHTVHRRTAGRDQIPVIVQYRLPEPTIILSPNSGSWPGR